MTLCPSVESGYASIRDLEYARLKSRSHVSCSPFMVIRRPAACRCTQATLPGKARDLPVCAIARPLPCPNNQGRQHAWLCNPVPMQPLEAGMMNPRRLSTVPAPLLRSVILATGVVGLLAAFGPAGIQNTGAAPSKDIRASSLSTEQELAGAPQPSSMLNDDLGQTDVAMAGLSQHRFDRDRH